MNIKSTLTHLIYPCLQRNTGWLRIGRQVSGRQTAGQFTYQKGHLSETYRHRVRVRVRLGSGLGLGLGLGLASNFGICTTPFRTKWPFGQVTCNRQPLSTSALSSSIRHLARPRRTGGGRRCWIWVSNLKLYRSSNLYENWEVNCLSDGRSEWLKVLLTSVLRQRGYVITCICLSINRITSKISDLISVKVYGMLGDNSGTNLLDFGGNPDLDSDPEILWTNFTIAILHL